MLKWSILIAGVVERVPRSNGLVESLRLQVQSHKDVNVVALLDDCKLDLGDKRNALVNLANAEYVSFVDDDDLVPDDYVDTIRPLLDGVDYIGFQVRYLHRNERKKPVSHNMKYPKWYEDANGFYRNVSHLNPIKRDIAKQFSFVGLMGEDKDWAQKVYDSGLVKTQYFIDREMYIYQSNPDTSVAWRESLKK